MTRAPAPNARIPAPRRTDPDVLAHQHRLMSQAAAIHAEEIWRAEGTRRPCRCDICAATRGDALAFARALADALRRRNARLGWS